MVKSQACEACAKRKVRCDRQEPSCSNCKRRKQDRCTYPDASPFERIRLLEEQVRSLGGYPTPDAQEKPTSNGAPPELSETRTQSPVLLRDAGRSVYLESEGWQTWINTSLKTEGNVHRSIYSPGRILPDAFEGSLWRSAALIPDFSTACCVSNHDATKLWTVFLERVEPVIKILFEWTLQHLQAATLEAEKWQRLSHGERTTVFAILLFGTVSLSEGEAIRTFGKLKSVLITEYRALCEQSMARINLLAIDDMHTLQALCFYMKASVDRVTTQSLWGLMGLASRSAEHMGYQRDGQLLGLSPVETEERRRLWWQLQTLDLIFAIKMGVTPLTFTADWDVRLPLNIEDRDIAVPSATPPEERTELTSLSYTLFTNWILAQQRNFIREARQGAQVAGRSLLSPLTDAMISGLEARLNKMFLQYCDPIRPIDALIQISARAVICVLRLRRLHEMRLSSQQLADQLRDEYFDTCLQSLQYVIASYCQPSLRNFQWMAEGSFAWHSFVGILVDLSQRTDIAKVTATWALLGELYASVPFLTDFSEDRRRAFAADSAVATWKACHEKPSLQTLQKPAFIDTLEQVLAQHRGAVNSEAAMKVRNQADSTMSDAWMGQGDANGIEPFNFNFADIDWSFWNSIS